MTRTEWLQWRHEGLGSSDAPVIVGVSPYRTIDELLVDKTTLNLEEKSNYITDLGSELEPRIRALAEFKLEQTFEPELLEMPLFPFLRASLDGRNGDTLIEIKLSGRAAWEEAKAGKVPDKYYPQVQHQFMVSGCQRGYYVPYLYEKGMSRSVVSMDKLITLEIFPDHAYIKNLFIEEVKFWEQIKQRRIKN